MITLPDRKIAVCASLLKAKTAISDDVFGTSETARVPTVAFLLKIQPWAIYIQGHGHQEAVKASGC